MDKDKADVYIGRPGHGESGLFGNPIKAKSVCSVCHKIHRFGSETLPCFEQYMLNRMAIDPTYKEALLGLKGKTLGCFCAAKGGITAEDDLICHGQIIAAWLDKQ